LMDNHCVAVDKPDQARPIHAGIDAAASDAKPASWARSRVEPARNKRFLESLAAYVCHLDLDPPHSRLLSASCIIDCHCPNWILRHPISQDCMPDRLI